MSEDLDTPNLDKMREHANDSGVIMEFLEWLESKGMSIGHDRQYEDYWRPIYVPISQNAESLIADYFGIDLSAADRERLQILEAFRRAEEAAPGPEEDDDVLDVLQTLKESTESQIEASGDHVLKSVRDITSRHGDE